MKRPLTEANLTNFKDLATAIEAILDKKDIPQFAGSEVNKVRNWFIKKYIQAIKDDEVDLKSAIVPHKYKEGEPEWMNKADILDFTGELPNDIVDEINHIVDYFATLDQNDLRKIDRESYKTIKDKVREWDRELASSSGDSKKEDDMKKTLVDGTDYRVVSTYPGGLKWVYLLNDKAKQVEGDVMGHCVGRGGYSKADIYSLFDSKNRSHVTIEANDNNKEIKQIKGKGNRAPIDKYLPVTIEFVADRIMNGYNVIADGENIGMIKYENEFHFDDTNVLPEKYRDKTPFRKWADIIYPTKIYPNQQKAIRDIISRIKEV